MQIRATVCKPVSWPFLAFLIHLKSLDWDMVLKFGEIVANKLLRLCWFNQLDGSFDSTDYANLSKRSVTN